MLKFILKRFLAALPTLFILITLSFFMMRLAPGSPFTSEKTLPPEIMANLEAKYGFDKPLHKQYFKYLLDIMQGDFGPSFNYKDHLINDLIASAFPVSLKLGAISFFFIFILGITAGSLAALKQNSRLDYIIMSFSMIGMLIPSFVIAPLLIFIFSILLKWLPAGGWYGGGLRYTILPIIALSLPYIAKVARITRASFIETLNMSFIRTAWAKGLPTYKVILTHALKPALIPVLSYMAPVVVYVITGSVVIESIFGLPGVGQLFVNGALNRDYALVMSITILIGSLTILFNAIVDILIAMIDPKIRY